MAVDFSLDIMFDIYYAALSRLTVYLSIGTRRGNLRVPDTWDVFQFELRQVKRILKWFTTVKIGGGVGGGAANGNRRTHYYNVRKNISLAIAFGPYHLSLFTGMYIYEITI